MSYFTLKDGQKLYYEDRGQGKETVKDTSLPGRVL